MGESNILAIITTKNKRDKVGGGVPIFYADSQEEMEEMSSLLARITLAMVTIWKMVSKLLSDIEGGDKINYISLYTVIAHCPFFYFIYFSQKGRVSMKYLVLL